jgi:cytochrome c oxidase subunit 2
LNSTEKLIGIAYAVVVVLGLFASWGIWSSTRVRQPTDPRKLAERERFWLVLVVGFLAALLLATIFFIPYGKTAPRDAQIVRVTGVQFAWRLQPATIRAGKPVDFRLTSVDVNHGFGVYDAKERLVFQVQVVPGKTQRYVHTFRRPGVYRILCLEFCGIGHHLMEGSLTVTRG